LLVALAGGKTAQISIDYFEHSHLDLRVTPC
jgi:hypothetical protein